MRLWSVHPKYLDAAGLVALWREGLLAQKVLAGLTRGYRQHPQLIRFREQADPSAAIACYLRVVAEEAARRGYAFDHSKIAAHEKKCVIRVSDGQVAYEWKHLLDKLRRRRIEVFRANASVVKPDVHPMFVVIAGDVEQWERVASSE